MLESTKIETPSKINRKYNKVLLINLPAVLAAEDGNIHQDNVMHLGIAYLASALRDQSYDVRILDCYAEDMHNLRNPVDASWIEYGLSDEQIIDHVSRYSPDLVGISIPFSCQHYVGHRIARLLKLLYPHIPIVTGGNHITALPEKISTDCFDYLVIGEGEDTFLRLLDELNHIGQTGHVQRVYSGGDRAPVLINDLDRLPFPALDLLPLSKLWNARSRWINMVATRGCVYSCNFCSIHTIMGYTIRRRSVENVISEILHWKNEYRIQEIYFEDDNLTANKQWAKQLFRRISELKLGMRFHVRNGIRADTVDKELLLLMRKAGFQDFTVSPETGSQKTLDEIIGKKAKLEDYENAVKLAQEVGIGVNAFFVLGFPGESWEDLNTTIKFARHLKELGAVGFSFSTATPYPGTRLFAQCVDQGFIDPDHFDYRRLRTIDYVIDHPIFNREELLAYQKKVMEEFSPPMLSIFGRMIKRISLLFRDPAMFYTKLRFNLYLIFS